VRRRLRCTCPALIARARPSNRSRRRVIVLHCLEKDVENVKKRDEDDTAGQGKPGKQATLPPCSSYLHVYVYTYVHTYLPCFGPFPAPISAPERGVPGFLARYRRIHSTVGSRAVSAGRWAKRREREGLPSRREQNGKMPMEMIK